MSDKQNYPSISLSFSDEGSILELGEYQDRRNSYFEDLPEPSNDNFLHVPRFANQLEVVPDSSFRTISRGSLEIIPDPCEMVLEERFGESPKMATPWASTENDHFLQEEEEIVERERKLINETQQLIISDADSDNLSQTSIRKWPQKKQKPSIAGSLRQPRRQRIDRVKNLLRQIKKRKRQGIDQLYGNFLLRCQGREMIISQGCLKAVVSQRQEIVNLLIQKEKESCLLKMKNGKKLQEEIKVQFWNKAQQEWQQYTLAIQARLN